MRREVNGVAVECVRGDITSQEDVAAVVNAANAAFWARSCDAGQEVCGMKLLYIVTKGTGDATLASIPLHLAANGSIEVGQEVSVVLAGDATELVIGDNASNLEGVGVPPMRDLLGKLKEHEVPVYV